MARHKVIPVRLSFEEWKQIKAKADKVGLAVSSFIRSISIKNS